MRYESGKVLIANTVWISATVVTILILCVVFFARSMNGNTYDKTSEWPEYYAKVASNYFKLPSEAVIDKVTHTDSAIMGMNFEVRFKLTNRKKPEEWLDSIAQASGIKPQYKRNKYTYDCENDCENDCDLLRLKYLPKEKMYIASAGWD